MRQKVAKSIRKAIYRGEKEESVKDRGYIEIFGGTFVSTEKRRKYKLAKKEYKYLKRSGKLNG
jgi:hypothetical protein